MPSVRHKPPRKRCWKCRDTKSVDGFRLIAKYGDRRSGKCLDCEARTLIGPRRVTTHADDEREVRLEVVTFLVCSLAQYGEDQVVESCIEVLGEMTLNEIGIVFGVCRERIRQIEELALRKAEHRARLFPDLKEAM